jgi:hypothetical protein
VCASKARRVPDVGCRVSIAERFVPPCAPPSSATARQKGGSRGAKVQLCVKGGSILFFVEQRVASRGLVTRMGAEGVVVSGAAGVRCLDVGRRVSRAAVDRERKAAGPDARCQRYTKKGVSFNCQRAAIQADGPTVCWEGCQGVMRHVMSPFVWPSSGTEGRLSAEADDMMLNVSRFANCGARQLRPRRAPVQLFQQTRARTNRSLADGAYTPSPTVLELRVTLGTESLTFVRVQRRLRRVGLLRLSADADRSA